MKILCYGDSNTYGFNPHDFSRYKEPWPSILRNHEVINHGYNGRTLLSYRDENFFPSAQESFSKELSQEYDLIIIMLGTNDLKYQYHMDYGDFRDGYTSIIASIREKYPQQKILILPVAEIMTDSGEWLNAKAKRLRVNEIIRDIASELKTAFLDYGRIEISKDLIHFTDRGHQQLAGIINYYLEEKQKSI